MSSRKTSSSAHVVSADTACPVTSVGIPGASPAVSSAGIPSVSPKKRSRRDHHSSTSIAPNHVSPSPSSVAYASLLPVSISYVFFIVSLVCMFKSLPRTSHPTGIARQQLCSHVSYGELTPEEIAAVLHHRELCMPSLLYLTCSDLLAPTPPYTQADPVEPDSDDTDGSVSGHESGSASRNPFVDDIAEESDRQSLSGSGSEDAADDEGQCLSDMDYWSDSPLPVSRLHPVRSSGRATTKTEKGEYVKNMLDNGLADDLVSDDDFCGDPSVAISVKRPKSSTPFSVQAPPSSTTKTPTKSMHSVPAK
ncbi:hypothetical protein ARMSODRAFT_1022526 [Armillaria solidipes]|uniref:Uncharacterized protein n=1 Tax=Armillaria solidipes TaxID=1076256 RepID=A0A2H3B2K8_9AGAR|nr:hypothetical protein ARMSODRAFT_1022526 [Armillaria solidipes]